MKTSFLDRTFTETHQKGKISEENFADKTLFKERLIRNFITYVKQTGDCNYLSLLNANKLELNKDTKIESLKEQKILEKINTLYDDNKLEGNKETEIETSQTQKILIKIDTNISESCLNLKDIIKQFAESLHPTNQSENIRNLLEDITNPTQTPYLITALKEEHKKLARFLDLIIAIAKKKGDQSLKQFIRDLTYYREYISYHAQPTKIQHDLSQISDSFLYLRRLNQYLDLLPETVTNLIDIMANTSE